MARTSQTIINRAFRALRASRHTTSPIRKWTIITNIQAKVNITAEASIQAKDSILKAKIHMFNTPKANIPKIHIIKDINGSSGQMDMSQAGLLIMEVLVS